MFDWEELLMNAVGFTAAIGFIVIMGAFIVSFISEVF